MVASLAASVVLLVSFVLIEMRSSRPLLPMRVLADRNRSGAYLIMLCIATGLFGLFFFLTLFIQTVLGYSAIRAGIAYLPFAIGVVIASGAGLAAGAADRPTAADPGRRRHGRGRDVLVFQADRARRLRRPSARPDSS